MTTPIPNNHIAVPVPEGIVDVAMEAGSSDAIRYLPKGYNNIHDSRRIQLPPGSWNIVSLLSKVTEEQARGIVDWYGAGDGSVDEAGVGDIFMCYDDYDFCFNTAIESFNSLIQSLGLKGEHVILKQSS